MLFMMKSELLHLKSCSHDCNNIFKRLCQLNDMILFFSIYIQAGIYGRPFHDFHMSKVQETQNCEFVAE